MKQRKYRIKRNIVPQLAKENKKFIYKVVKEGAWAREKTSTGHAFYDIISLFMET